jgi:hypothetical protein
MYVCVSKVWHFSLSSMDVGKGDLRIISTTATGLRSDGDGLTTCNVCSIPFLYPTLIPLSEVGKTCILSCCDKDSAIVRDNKLWSTFL